jgi:predicted thioesterase
MLWDAMFPFLTPVMIMMMESAALNATAYLDPRSAPSRASFIKPTGRSNFTPEVTRCEGRRIEFRIEANDATEQIGAGTHERIVINLAKFSEQLKAKLP